MSPWEERGRRVKGGHVLCLAQCESGAATSGVYQTQVDGDDGKGLGRIALVREKTSFDDTITRENSHCQRQISFWFTIDKMGMQTSEGVQQFFCAKHWFLCHLRHVDFGGMCILL